MPPFDVGTEPQHRAPRPQVHDRARHIRIARLVLADGIAVTEAEDFGNVACVDQIVHENSSRHNISLRESADTSISRKQFRPRAGVV
jgi:hypothetical protein